jgi:hypothetical protein
MSKYGIFFQPKEKLSRFINDYKKRVDQALPNQAYCNHPPHSTILCTWLKEIEQVKFVLDELLSQESSIPYNLKESMCFYDDALTGGHTVAMRIDDTSGKMAGLQVKVAEGLREFIDFSAAPQPSGFLLSDPFRSSYEKFASPFVGSHWIPHMSIASLKVEKEDPLLLSLLKSEFKHVGFFNEVSLVEIKGDIHSCIKTYTLT